MKRWTVVLVGQQSGVEREVKFLRSFRKSTCQQYANRINTNGDHPNVVARVRRRVRRR